MIRIYFILLLSIFILMHLSFTKRLLLLFDINVGIQHDLSDQNLASKHDLSVHDLSQHDLSQHDLSQHSLGQNDLSVHDLSQHDLSVHEAKGMRRSYRQPAPAPRNINLTSRR